MTQDLSTMRRRYQDANAVAQGLVSQGGAIKALGIILMVLTLLVTMGFFERLGMVVAIPIFAVGVGFGASIFALGTLVSASGQLLLASLDTALNTSPLLDVSEKRELILNVQPGATGSAAGSAEVQPRDPSKCPTCGKAGEKTAAHGVWRCDSLHTWSDRA